MSMNILAELSLITRLCLFVVFLSTVLSHSMRRAAGREPQRSGGKPSTLHTRAFRLRYIPEASRRGFFDASTTQTCNVRGFGFRV